MLTWLEETGLALWLRESPLVWAHPTVLTLHTMGMGVLVGACWVLDLRLLGITRNIPLTAFRWVFPVVAIGLTVNLVTGVLLFVKNATVWGTAIPFLVKMVLVVASVATLMPIRALVMRSAAADGGASGLPADTAGANLRRGRLLAIVSLLAWAGAVTAGRLLAYVVV
jgi:hypothetical protein